MKKSVYVTFVLVLMNMFTSCASFMGTGIKVDLNSTPSMATATITDSKNKIVDTIITPGKIALPKAGKYTITFSKPEYISSEVSITSKFNRSFWLNFVIGALGGAGIAIGSNMSSGKDYGIGIYGYSFAGLGIVGALYDIFTGNLTGVSQKSATIVLVKTPEAQARETAAAERKAQLAAEEEAKRKAEAEERLAAMAAAQEVKSNPNKLDRSQYKKTAVEDFSFDMVAGKLPAGSKVAFEAEFFIKPTGTKYSFDDVNIGITISSDHNFVRDMPAWCFGSTNIVGQRKPQEPVTVYVTVKKSGQYGECSVDIIDWNDSPFNVTSW
jgi:hypothetical protein